MSDNINKNVVWISHYVLKQEKLFNDGFYVDTNTLLRKIDPSNDKFITVELVQFNCKRIFKVKSSEVTFVSADKEVISNKQLKNKNKERYDQWYSKSK